MTVEPVRPASRPGLVPVVLVTGVVFGGLDALWLGVVAGGFYDERIGHLLADSPNAAAAAAFYAVYVVGLVHFVVRPGLRRSPRRRALLDAAAFGVVTYATFDLTAMAVFRDVPLVVVLVDIAWGALLCTATTALAIAVLARVAGANMRDVAPGG